MTLKAPRTVIAAHSNGSLYLVEVVTGILIVGVVNCHGNMSQVDGIEHDKVGLDLYEMADVLVGMGLYQAVVKN